MWWTADKIAYRNIDTYTRAYQGSEMIWDKNNANKIFYTSTDGQIITPNIRNCTTAGEQQGGFGSNIVSNTYSNGQGVIVFDGPVTRIGCNTFASAYTLRTITIPETTTGIYYSAFYHCDNLISLHIPASVTQGLGDYGSILTYCSNLQSLTVDSNNPVYKDFGTNCIYIQDQYGDWILHYGCKSSTIYNGTTTIYSNAFTGSGLTTISIPASVTHIMTRAFYESGLTSITIPETVTMINDDVFNGCTSLTTVRFNGVTPPSTIGWDCFDNNASGRLIKVPANSVTAYRNKRQLQEYASSIVAQ